jgi:basic membrane protein A and related proteins
MRRIGFAAVLAFALAAPLAGLPKVAVLDILAQKGIDASVVVPVTESIMEQLVGTRAYVVLDRAYIELVLKEQEFDVSSMVSDTQVAKAGQYVGADYVVTGKVQVLGSAFFLVAKMIEVKTGVIVSQSSSQGSGELTALLDMARAVGQKLAVGAPISPLEPSKAGAAAAGATTARASPAAAPGASAARIKAGIVMPAWVVQGKEHLSIMMSVRGIARDFADWLDLDIAYGVDPPSLSTALDRLAGQDGCEIVLGCPSDLPAELFVEAARRHPGTLFEAFGMAPDWESVPNLGLYGFDWEWHYYLEGLVAGSMTKSGKVAFIGPPIADRNPQGVAGANLFALGVKASNSKAAVIYSIFPGHDPDSVAKLTRSLLAQGCDFFGGNEDYEEMTILASAAREGKRALLVIHEIGYQDFPDIAVSGPALDTGILLRRKLTALHEGAWRKENFVTRAVMRFGGAGPAFNPDFIPELGAKKVKTPDLGTLPLLELLDRRAQQIIEGSFEPFTGPIKDQKGKVVLAAGVRRDGLDFRQHQDWLLDNVKGSIQGE